MGPPKPEGERLGWPEHAGILAGAVVYGLLLGVLLSQDVVWWLAILAPLGWWALLQVGVAHALNRRYGKP